MLLLAALAGCVGDLLTAEQINARLDATPDLTAEIGGADGGSDLATAAELPDLPSDSLDTDLPGADAAADAADAADVQSPDTAAVCPGGAGCPCAKHADCGSGACVETPSGLACAASCDGGCGPAGLCGDPGVNGKALQVCLPRWLRLCDPCSADLDCQGPGIQGAKCLDLGPSGRFCGTACSAAGDCPAGYECDLVATVGGPPAAQCVRAPETIGGPPGTCPCSPLATFKKLASSCYVATPLPDGGTAKCGALRQCGLDGLTACQPPAPATETCNGTDDDCDGQVDEYACDDGNPCTIDQCQGGDCAHKPADGLACDDGKACTQGDTCQGGQCVAGAAVVCKPVGLCIDVTCTEPQGLCSPQPKAEGAGCDDANACTEGDGCKSGNCGGIPKFCDDGNPCTSDACDPAQGCKHLPNQALCTDDDVCTTADQCQGGKCAGTAKSCDDANPCTTDSCDSVQGCQHTASAGTCSDGNACTTGDTCQAGVCKPGPNGCECATDADCSGKDDANACNGTLFCDPGSKTCKTKPGSVPPPCSAPSPCVSAACNPASGQCDLKPVADGQPCDADSSACTAGDACQGGKCTAGKAVSCNDGNSCTTDACDPTAGCSHVPGSGACDDGNLCTPGDQCVQGVCKGGSPIACPAAGPCLTSSCNPATGKCSSQPAGGTCDDGSPCSVGDKCQDGACQAGPALDCGDGNPCTDDLCQVKDGQCLHVGVPPAGSPSCDGTTSGARCYKAQTMAQTWQQAEAGCVGWGGHLASITSAGDGQVVRTVASQACGSTFAGAWIGLSDIAVEGKWAWSDGTPVVWFGWAQGQPDGGSAADVVAMGNSGTWLDFLASDTLPCAVCERALPVPCQDGDGCTTGDTCKADKCVGTPNPCDDKNACTLDACSGGTCKNTPTTACDDGNPCTKNDSCAGTTCAGSPMACNDGNPCTVDQCDPSTGVCKAALLPDGSACAAGKTCQGGACGIPWATALFAGGQHACAILTSGSVVCWGDNERGQLGIGSGNSIVTSPKPVQGLQGIGTLGGGGQHTCAASALLTQAWCWGAGTKGQLGSGKNEDSGLPLPVKMPFVSGTVARLWLGGVHGCLSAPAGTWCWGDNDAGQIGTQQAPGSPVKPFYNTPQGIGAYEGVVSGAEHTCAIWNKKDAIGPQVVCWGANDKGQLGGTTTVPGSTHVLVSLPGGQGVPTQLWSGGHTTCAQTSSGAVFCWGANTKGQLGGTPGIVAQPKQVFAGGVHALALGDEHLCRVVQADKSVVCAGRGLEGQLGHGKQQDSATGVQVAGLPPVQQITAGKLFTCALTQSGTGWCWGDGSSGQLGHGKTSLSAVPVQVLK